MDAERAGNRGDADAPRWPKSGAAAGGPGRADPHGGGGEPW